MSVEQTSGSGCLRIVRRFLWVFLFVVGIGLLITGLGIMGIWGYFWDFHVGSPPSSTCVNCHEEYTATLTDNTMLVSNHANQDLTCVDCHDYSLEQQIQHTVDYLSEDYTEPLPREEYGMETCFACHEHGSYDQIVWRTTDLGVTDGKAKGVIANPHQPPHYDELECYSCHRMHRPSVLLCSECHSYEFKFPISSEIEE